MDKIFALERGLLKNIKDAVLKGKSVAVFNAAPNNRCHIASGIGKKFVYVAGDISEARKIYDRICEYGDGRYALLPEKEDALIRRKICDYQALGERTRILKDMIDGKLDGVVVTTDSLIGIYPEKSRFLSSVITLRKNLETDTSVLAEKLLFAGYRRVTEVDKPGTFRMTGDVLEIYPPEKGTPYRVDFFGDEVEKICEFTPETRVSGEETEELEILPASEILVYQDEVKGILNIFRKSLRTIAPELRNAANEEWENFAARPSGPLNVFMLPYLRAQSGKFLSYADGYVLVIDDARMISDKLKLSVKAFENRVEAMTEGGKAFPEHKKSIYGAEESVKFSGNTLAFGRITSSASGYGAEEAFNLKTTPLPPYYNDMEGFFTTVKQLLFRKVKVRVYASDETSEKALINAFHEHDVGITDKFTDETDIGIEVGKVGYGFFYPTENLMCIGINDLTRKTSAVIVKKKRPAVFELPDKGDYVVHEIHGIGISEGMQRVTTLSGEKDYFVVLYRGGDKLFLPVEQLDTIEKYNGADKPALHKLGGAEFERVKNRVRASVKEMAIDLLEVYKAREGRKGYVYQADTPWQKELEDDFEFTETEDQLNAVAEIKHDMESGKIMDRLLCGDVGYGKTEVAVRAIFKTVIEGKQAAVLAPTTILAQQHYNLLCARMNRFKLKIELLSRFVPVSEIKKSLERIKSGESNIIVATHRILGKDVIFNDLGLLVLDEEQRFGVEHKEKLKAIKSTVNVLSLSATPIPRTLHMALSGIRDISTLETPPKNRLPVETYVTEYSDELLKDALTRELSRGGQAFVLYNRVQGIEKFYQKVNELVGDRTEVIYAHGQMDEVMLENAIKKFYDGEAGVLVSTTIIENGIDLPNANTLFVVDSDRLGLSQLYQLRGRVGRSDVLAYAYFTVKEGKVLTESAVKRLDALMANTDLGSGFKIAMRDLEIRGAGNILGREQHGQMEKVGYEMYLKLVKEGIDEAQGKPVAEEREPELKLDGDFALEEKYIPDAKARISVYRTAAELATTAEGTEFYRRISDSYGENARLKNIIRMGILKNLAKKCGVKKVVADGTGTGLFFFDSGVLAHAGLFGALEEYKNEAVLCPTNPPSVIFNGKNKQTSAKLKMLKDFLEKLCAE